MSAYDSMQHRIRGAETTLELFFLTQKLYDIMKAKTIGMTERHRELKELNDNEKKRNKNETKKIETNEYEKDR